MSLHLNQILKSTVRTIPDFPIEGIMFREGGVKSKEPPAPNLTWGSSTMMVDVLKRRLSLTLQGLFVYFEHGVMYIINSIYVF